MDRGRVVPNMKSGLYDDLIDLFLQEDIAGLQDYIERHVKPGDDLKIFDGELRHSGREVGRLSRSTCDCL
jgi:hypothetical protein